MTSIVTRRIRMGKHSQKPLIWVTFPYDEPVSEMLKEVVQGIRWSRKEKMWTAPLDMDTARDIRHVARYFGAKLQIEPELGAWALKERDKIVNLLRPDDMFTDADKLLPLVRQRYPRIIKAMTEAKPWQIPGAAFIVSQKNVVVADQPGLGKTLQVLAALIELQMDGAVLVVAPKTAVEVTWPDEIARWLGPHEHIFPISASFKPAQRRQLAQQAKALAETGERVWVLTGPDYLRVKAELDDYGNYLRDDKGDKIIRTVGHTVADLFHIPFSTIIVDESQHVLATNTGNKKRWSAQRTGMGVLDTVPGSVRIAISGTPFRGRTEMIWGTLNWLDSKKYTSYWKWVRRHYGVVDTFHSDTETHLEKGDTIRDEKRFFSELRPILIRRTHRELRKAGFITGQKFYGGTHLDPADDSTPVAVWLPLAPKQAQQYKQIQEHATITLESISGERDEIVVNGSLAEMTRLKQVAGSTLGIGTTPDMPSAKVDWTINFLKERIENGTKTLVASQFTQFIELLSRECNKTGIPHYTFTGKTSGKDRARIKHEFQSESGEMVVILNTMSGGLSLTLDAADDVVVCDQTWIPDDQEQVENRAYGRERDHDVNVWNLCSIGTIDEDIAVLNLQREGEIFSVLDSQRGVSYVKQLVSMTINRTEAA
jgi:SNF2 family DNA or RNA helicase